MTVSAAGEVSFAEPSGLDGYKRVFEMSPVGLAITTHDGRFLDVNAAGLRMFGRRKDEVLGRTSIELGLLDPLEEKRHALLTTRLRERGTVRGELRTLHSTTGELFHVALIVDALEIDGEPRLLSTFFDVTLDVTQRKRTEEELRNSDAQLREAQEVTHLGSWEMDLRTKVVTRSAELCRIFGVDEEEYRVGPQFSEERIHPADRARFRREMAAAFSQGTPYAFECRIVRADGQVRHLAARGRVVCDEYGKPVRLLGTGQDVTERKAIEARLLLADRMASLGTLAAGIAHEINNPLSYVASNLSLALENLLKHAADPHGADNAELVELLRQAQEGAHRVRRIVRELKIFSRADEERRTAVDVRRALDAAVNLTSNEIRHRARLVRDYRPVPLVEADEARLAQVFINVLANAAQAMDVGRADACQITIATGTDAAGRATVTISDNGPGMPQDVMERVFDPFFTTKPVGEGSGLGMSICHGIVTALGGEISVQSEPGKGSEVRIVLPPASGDVLTPSSAPAARAAPFRARVRVLVLDDDARVAGAIRGLLAEHDVTVMTDPRAVLARIRSGDRYDVILCDLMMPEMTGMDLQAALSSDAADQAERMVFMTGGAFTPASREFLDRTPNACLEKPFDPELLRATVLRFAR